jgi:hypothetical protein
MCFSHLILALALYLVVENLNSKYENNTYLEDIELLLF